MSSDLTLFDFRKMPLKKLSADKEFKIKCKLAKPSQRIIVTAACDEIAGSAVRSELRHNLPASSFPEISVLGKTAEDLDKERALQELEECIDFFDKDDDLDLDLDSVRGRSSRSPPPKSIASAPPPLKGVDVEDDAESDPEPERLPNGNYKCLHSCKSSCRHLCCREGMERPPLKKKKKAVPALKATAEQPTTPTPLERLRQTDVNAQPAKERKQKTTQPVNTARSGSGSYSGAERESSKLSTKERIDFPVRSKNDAVLSDDDDDDELPLLFSRKRKYDVNWNAFEDVDDDFPTDGIKPSPATQKKKRAKVSFNKYIDDEAGEDNRPEHAAKGKGKAKGPSVTRPEEDAGNSYISEDEDAGSLVDFVVDDHVDPTIDFSEDDLTLPQNHDDERYGDKVSRGDLVDCGLDDLAHLFTDSEPEDGPLLNREGVRDPPKTSSRIPNTPTEDMSAGLAFAAGSDDGFPLFLSEDWVPGAEIDIAAPLPEPRRAGPASVDSGIDLAFLDDESPADITAAVPDGDDEDAPDDQDVVNEDMALGVRDGDSPVPSLPERRHDVASGSKVWKSSQVDPQQQPSKVTDTVSPVLSLPVHHRQDTASNHKAIVEPPRVEDQQQSKATPVVPDRPAVRRPTFADRMLAKLQQARLNDASQKPSTAAAAAAVTAVVQVAQPSSSTSRMVDTIYPAEESAQQQQDAVCVAPSAVPSTPGDEETWSDWDLLKG
ncbi:hypothetical protein A4X06_0g7880 [Tilletia controversa]|uniref:Uncharacterized protein n=1 Tax=Tilletia controversa TaxID=13291 RepID=A0A8X7ML04_9BASI|nr:hypothetical protein A4X06_0g7880 [Tilletia controversa]